MKCHDIITEDEFIPRNTSGAGKLARQLLDNAKGNPGIAMKMADRFAQKVKDAIAQEQTGGISPEEQHNPYKQTPPRGSNFSANA